MSNNFSIFFLTNGRYGYLQRTISSWQTNLEDDPQHRIIFDDSGNYEYFKKIKLQYGKDFEVVRIQNNINGHAGAMSFIFKYLKSKDSDYFLQVEEDWMLFRQVSVKKIINVLENNKNILQMRIPRAVWYTKKSHGDMIAGSSLSNCLNLPGAYWTKRQEWFEWRSEIYFWSHNPSIFPRSIIEEDYPQINQLSQHEKQFGINLLEKYPNGLVAFWANNIYDAYVLHIGFHDDKLLETLQLHEVDYNIGVKFGGK